MKGTQELFVQSLQLFCGSQVTVRDDFREGARTLFVQHPQELGSSPEPRPHSCAEPWKHSSADVTRAALPVTNGLGPLSSPLLGSIGPTHLPGLAQFKCLLWLHSGPPQGAGQKPVERHTPGGPT